MRIHRLRHLHFLVISGVIEVDVEVAHDNSYRSFPPPLHRPVDGLERLHRGFGGGDIPPHEELALVAREQLESDHVWPARRRLLHLVELALLVEEGDSTKPIVPNICRLNFVAEMSFRVPR